MIKISEIFRPLNVTPAMVETIAFKNGIKFQRPYNAAAIFTDDAAARIIELIKQEKERDEFIRLSEVAKNIRILQAQVRNYMNTLGIKTYKRGAGAFMTKQDAERVYAHRKVVIAEQTKPLTEKEKADREYHKHRYMMRLSGVKTRRNIGKELELMAKQQYEEQRKLEMIVSFYHKNGSIKTGTIIGGLDRVNEETVMIRYIESGCKFIAEVRYSAVIGKSFDHVAELVKRAKSERKE